MFGTPRFVDDASRVRVAVVLSLLMVAVLLVAVFRPADDRPGTDQPERGAATAASGCPDVLTIAFPGNNERRRNASDAGATVNAVRAAFTSKLGRARSVEHVVVPVRSVSSQVLRGKSYWKTAANRAVTRTKWVRWRAGVGPAVSSALATLRSAAATCPEQSIAVFGFSQGAEAAHRLLVRLGATSPIGTRVVSAVLVSDGARQRNTRATRVGSPYAAARSRSGVSTRYSRLADVPASNSRTGIWTLCASGDIVCDLSGIRVSKAVGVSRSYVTRARIGLTRDIGRRAAIRMTRIPKVPAPRTYHGTVGEALNVRLPVRVYWRDRSSVRWTALSGLPAGVSLSPKGVLIGEPLAAGTHTVTYEVRNHRLTAYSRPMRGTLTLKVDAAVAPRMSAGGTNTCTVRSDGSLWCWGANTWGQVGDGSKRDRRTPVRLGTSTNWGKVSTSGSHSCAISKDGRLFCWGLNTQGMLGTGDVASRTRPVYVSPANRWSDVATAWFSTCGVTKVGRLFCWGSGSKGKLGLGTWTKRVKPAPVDSTHDWLSVTADGEHACAIKKDGSAWCWGDNSMGQLGDGTWSTRPRPVRVAGGDTWRQLSVSWSHTCGITGSGKALCWGFNTNGQLGDGTAKTRRTPVEVSGGGDWAALSAGDSHTCGRTRDGRVWCWGDNAWGQLGTGTRSRSRVPVNGTTMGDWLWFDNGWQHSCGTRADGGLYCWGASDRGQLGDGGPSSRTSPYLVMRG